LPETASAQRVRVRAGGGVHVRGHVRVGGPAIYGRGYGRGHVRGYGRIYGRGYRPYYRPRVFLRYYPRPYIDPYYYWGFHYAAPPPCYYECGPSYYGAPPPATVAVAAPVHEPPLPRLGLGIFGGSTEVQHNDPGGDVGLIGRLRLTRHLLLEAEVSKSELSDGHRVDKRIGGALLIDFLPRSALSPYILGGGGFGQTDVNDGTLTAEQAYAELGAGLEWRLGRHFALFADLRAGVRDSNASDDEILLVRGSSGGNSGPTIEDNERFTRGRIGAMLYF
jgi:hypothetical protein